MRTVILDVPDMECDHCVQTVTNALRPLPGVAAVAVDLPGKTVRMSYDEREFDMDTAYIALGEEGYPIAAKHSA